MVDTATAEVVKSGQVELSEVGVEYQTAMLPSDTPQNHASNLQVMPNGDVLCVWFAGTQEGISDISIYISRLKNGESRWSQAKKLSDDPQCSEQNPVLFLTPQGELWLLWTAQKSGNQDTAIVRCRKSTDGGENWGEISVLLDQPGTFIRQPIVIADNGNWLLPVFYCRVKTGEKWVGNYDVSAVKISQDQGKTWRDVDVPESLGCVHMSIAKMADGGLLALYRSRWADFIYKSISLDNGETWSKPEATDLPNNNSSIQVTTLNNGHLALVFNNMSAEGASERRLSLYDEIEDDDTTTDEPTVVALDNAEKTAFWGAPRAPMTLAISKDNGKTWPIQINLDEGDGYCMTNNSKEQLNREFSYPSVKQGVDGSIHVTYTYFRQAIKYVRLTPQQVELG